MNYREDKDMAKAHKQRYLDGLERLVAVKNQEMSCRRSEYAKNIFTKQEAYREDFKKMLGWPLVGHADADLPVVKSEMLAKEQGYTVYRMTFTVLDGLEMTGLYFEMDTDEARPLVLVQHGGLGTPELISGVYGDTANYNRILERVIAQGTHAFATQLLLWDKKQYGVEYDRQMLDARLKRVGSSITAVELYGLKRILDYFEVQKNVSTLGMVGMSYGGFYTLFMTALDTRIRSAISCSFFNTRDQIGWCDWVWQHSAGLFDDAEIACLVYPRKLCIEIGTRDELFDAKYGKQSFARLTELCREVGTDWVTFIPFDGTHEFCHDDAPIEKLARELQENA